MKWKGLTSLVLVCISVSLISGCFSKNDLKKPIGKVLLEQYGIEDFTILSTTNNWFEGVSHDTVIEIEKPYYTVSRFFLERDTYLLYEDFIFEDILKGAFVTQFPEFMALSDEVIKKYNLEAETPQFESDKIKSFHYNIQFFIEDQQKQQLREQFKQSQSIDVKSVIPTLPRVKPGDGINLYWQAPVNFIYYFNTATHTGDVPHASKIAEEFQQSGTLPAGIYHVMVQTIFFDETTFSSGMTPEKDSQVVFQLDADGTVTALELYDFGF